MAVALFRQEPTSNESDLPVIFTQAPEFGAPAFDFLWDVPAGEYGYLVVAWMREGANILDIASWVVIGFHAESGSPMEPKSVLVTPGTLRMIDLSGDFSVIPADYIGRKDLR